MNRKVKELKRIARGNLQGHYLELIRAYVFCTLIVSLIETPFSMMRNDIPFSTTNIIYYIAVILITVASVVLTVGQLCLHLRVARTAELHLSELFYPVKHDANRLIIAETILFVIEIVSLLPILGALTIVYFYDKAILYLLALILGLFGIALTAFVTVTFGLTYFVLIDNETFSVKEAILGTLKLVKTHKKRYLYLHLSFLGMYFLGFLSLGIGLLWVQAYEMQTLSLFYLDIKGELDEVLENRKRTGSTPEPVAFDRYV